MRSSGTASHSRVLRHRGSALLMVLWATAALAAIALALANTVRAEAERATTGTDSLKAYYLAGGALDRGLLWIEWGLRGINMPNSQTRYYQAPTPVIPLEFPEGEAWVEVVPELSKLNINRASEQDLAQLIAAAGEPDKASAIAAAIIDWRSAPEGGATSTMD